MAASPGRTQGMTSFTAFDIPGDKPLEYDVSLQINRILPWHDWYPW
jgi:hypothetical protein